MKIFRYGFDFLVMDRDYTIRAAFKDMRETFSYAMTRPEVTIYMRTTANEWHKVDLGINLAGDAIILQTDPEAYFDLYDEMGIPTLTNEETREKLILGRFRDIAHEDHGNETN